MNVHEMAEILIEELGVCEETVETVAEINGWNEKTMRDILYVVTGYNDFDQLED